MTRRQKTVSKVLELKGFTREQLQSEVKECWEAYQYEKEKLDTLESELSTHLEEFRQKQDRGTVGIREMDLFYTYFQHLERHVQQQKECVHIRRKHLDTKLEAMHEAYKEQRLMEILRDKIVCSEVRATMHREQKETDYQFLARRTK
ncbi:MAG: flagellar FliJ family protein [Nitrospirota bacterium]